MDAKSQRLDQRQAETTAAAERSTQRSGTREFGSVEEVLRADRSQITVPPALVQQLAQATRGTREARRPWWARWLNLKDRS